MTMIVTHGGSFHADDVFACAVVKVVFPDARVVRTRDPEVIASADVVFDVGGVYDAKGKRFDHHQKPPNGERWPIEPRANGVPYSSFGLVWRHYGHDCCGSMGIAHEVDQQLVQSVDAADCGFSLHGVATTDARTLSVSAMVSLLNPTWEEEGDFDGAFARAVDLAEMILRRAIASAAAKIAAEKAVEAAAATPGPTMVLDRYLPWASMPVRAEKLFCVFPAAAEGTWMVQCVPEKPGSFQSRKPLPEAWGGLRGEELAALTGVGGAVFCHINLFIGGATSLEGALALAKLAAEA